MINPVQVSEDIFVFRGFPAAVKHAEYNKNLINIIFHSDTTKKFEEPKNLLSTSAWLNDGKKISMGEIALMCENKFIVAVCKKTPKGFYDIKNITIVPTNAYTNDYTKEKLNNDEYIPDGNFNLDDYAD